MKRALPLLALLSASTAFAVAVGDSYDQVIAEKGKPTGVMAGGPIRVLTYPDAIIKVRGDAVVSVRVPDKERPYVPTPLPVRPAAPVAPALDYDGPAEWGTDVRAAVAQAKARNCHILMLFTGSDWCTWCARMDSEVYSKPEFAAYSHDKYVLLKLDYPQRTPQPEDLRLQNRRLAGHYQVKGYPMVIVVDAMGGVLGRLDGYHPGGTEAFLAWAKQFE